MAKKKNKPTKGKKRKVTTKKTTGNSFWKQKDKLIPLLIALAVTFMVFIPSLSNDFVNWDDDVNILENENLERFDVESILNIFDPVEGLVIGNYNPLTIFTFAIEKHLFGLNAKPFHVNNLILHLLCVFFVYRIMLMMNIGTTGALIVALLFGIHPMRVESVAWVTERKDVLFGVFYLAAIFQYLKYLKNKTEKRKRFVIITVLFILSLLSKIQAVSLPLSLLAIDYYFRRPLNFQLIKEKLLFFGLSLFFGLLGVFSLKDAGSLDDITQFSFPERLLIGAYSHGIYLVKAIFPYLMSPLYPYPSELDWKFYIAPLFVIAVLGFVYWLHKKDYRAVVFGYLFFLVNVVFMLQILGAGQGFIADRFTYIPYLGLFFIVGYYIHSFQKESRNKGQYLVYGMGAYLVLCAFLTWRQCSIWENGETLWTHVINSKLKSALPYNNRGFYRREKGQYPEALKDYDEAIKANPRKASTYNSRGKTHFDMGNAQLALKDYDMAIQLDKTEAEYFVNRGAAKGSLGKINEALSDLSEGIKVDPDFDNAYLNRSLAYNQVGQYQLAINDIEKYLTLKPFNADMWYELAINKQHLNKNQEALLHLDKAISISASNGLYFYERGKVKHKVGRTAEGQQDIRQAQQMGIKPEPHILQMMGM